ncbi:energy coupling factor transporter S component ThiW [Candidatus Bathyarchaeota archaeon]|nr:energy coupling factor transporter S component ThiW [Candidatus Bathyarchaeota archaeon]
MGAVGSPSRNAAAAAVLAAIAVALSPLSFPVGPTKVYPAQHMVNGVGGVLLGPWYAALVAVVVAFVRNVLGTGTVFAFPGGVPGALLVGLVHKYLWRRDYAALLEPVGTAFGAVMSALVVAPLALQLGSIRLTLTLEAFLIAFLASSIPGAILGFIVLLVIRRSRGLIP